MRLDEGPTNRFRSLRTGTIPTHPAECGDQLGRRRVGHAAEDHTGPMVVHQRLRTVPPAGPHLGQVLEAGDQGDPVAGTGGGEHVEVGQRGDGRRLVEDDQQRLCQPATLRRRRGECRAEDLVGGGGEERGEASLVVGRRAQVEGAALLEEAPRVEHLGRGLAEEWPDHGLRGRDHRGELAVLAGQRRAQSGGHHRILWPPEPAEGLGTRLLLEPAVHQGEIPVGAMGGQQQTGEVLRRQMRPEGHLPRGRTRARRRRQARRHPDG